MVSFPVGTVWISCQMNCVIAVGRVWSSKSAYYRYRPLMRLPEPEWRLTDRPFNRTRGLEPAHLLAKIACAQNQQLSASWRIDAGISQQLSLQCVPRDHRSHGSCLLGRGWGQNWAQSAARKRSGVRARRLQTPRMALSVPKPSFLAFPNLHL
jgi:hypothetical protein